MMTDDEVWREIDAWVAAVEAWMIANTQPVLMSETLAQKMRSIRLADEHDDASP